MSVLKKQDQHWIIGNFGVAEAKDSLVVSDLKIKC